MHGTLVLGLETPAVIRRDAPEPVVLLVYLGSVSVAVPSLEAARRLRDAADEAVRLLEPPAAEAPRAD